MGSVRIAGQNIIDLTDDLDLSRSQSYKSHFGPYLGSCWTNCPKILALSSLDRGLSTNQKTSWTVWTWGVRKRVTLATIMQKDVFDHNFRTIKYWTNIYITTCVRIVVLDQLCRQIINALPTNIHHTFYKLFLLHMVSNRRWNESQIQMPPLFTYFYSPCAKG